MASAIIDSPRSQREKGIRTEGFACAKAHQSIVGHQRRSLAILGRKKSSRSIRSLSTRSIGEDLGEASLHDICSNFARGLYGGSEHSEKSANLSTSSFDVSLSGFGEDEIELQREALAAIEEKRQHEIHQDDLPDDVATEKGLIEVSPGVSLPLRGSKETWAALLEGRLTVTKCSCCQEELSCIDDAHLVVCCDCWVISPVDQSIGGMSLDYSEAECSYSVGLGVKASEIGEWIVAAQQE
jgi:hypothetical protein